MDIKEFLLARIAEDEVVARAASEPSPHWGRGTDKAGDSDITYYVVEPVNPYVQDACIADLESTGRVGRAHAGHIARYDPARVLRECAAKRAIVGTYAAVEANRNTEGSVQWHEERALLTSVRVLATVYSDHPDYQQEWSL